ncbi:MAG: Flp pilus assembly protein CpaB [Burkholderiaceae bacterium]
MKRIAFPMLQRLRSPQTRILIAAVGLGLAATFLSHSAQTQERFLLKETLIQAEALTEVVVAGRALPRNTVVREEDLAIRLLPQSWLHAEHVSPEATDLVLGARLKRDVPSGSPIAVSDTESSETPTKTITVRPGYRLLSLPADETSSVSGLIRPGHWIDLWASSAVPLEPAMNLSNTDIRVVQAAARPPVPADLVASAIRVVAVGGDTRATSSNHMPDESPGATRYSSLTIEVPGDLVAPLLAAQTRGRLIALLRPDVLPTSVSRRSSTAGASSPSGSSPAKATPVEIIVHSPGGQS